MTTEDNAHTNTPPMVTVAEFEQEVLALEGIAIVLRLPSRALVRSYGFSKRSPNSSIKAWVARRVRPKVGRDTQFVVLHPEGHTANIVSKLAAVRHIS